MNGSVSTPSRGDDDANDSLLDLAAASGQPHQPSPALMSATPSSPDPAVPHLSPRPPHGDTFLLHCIGNGFTIGLDTLALTTTSSPISGFRDISEGPHLLWVSGPHSLSRTGYWFVADPCHPRVRARRWDPHTETLTAIATVNAADDDGAAAAYPRLVPHAYCRPGAVPRSDDPATWRRLTSAITAALLDRITGGGEAGGDEWAVDTADGARGDEGRLAPAGGGCGELDFFFAPDGGVLRPAPDPTARLLAAQAAGPGTPLLFEQQFAFLTGAHLGNHACLSQWRRLVRRGLLRAGRLAVEAPELCAEMLDVLLAQLVYARRHLDGAAAGNPAEMRAAVEEYGRLLGAGGGPVREALERLERWLWGAGMDGDGGERASHGWGGEGGGGGSDEDEDDEEDAPVVVELDEEGKEVGLLRWG